jgi:hypothetical protein
MLNYSYFITLYFLSQLAICIPSSLSPCNQLISQQSQERGTNCIEISFDGIERLRLLLLKGILLMFNIFMSIFEFIKLSWIETHDRRSQACIRLLF